MQDLSLLLASKQLFLSLSIFKIKTLKQAQQLIVDQTHRDRIVSLTNDYQQKRKEVEDKLNRTGNDLQLSKNKDISFEMGPIGYHLNQPAIIEIIGAKGSGKTALALNIAQSYLQMHKERCVKIINCAGGITSARLSKFHKNSYQYCDIFSFEDIFDVILKNKKSTGRGMIILDGAANLLLSVERPKAGLGDSLLTLRDLGWTIIFTNFPQGRLQVQGKQVLNMPAYFPHILGGLANCRILITQQLEKSYKHKITLLKSLDSKHYEYEATMQKEGITKMFLSSH